MSTPDEGRGARTPVSGLIAASFILLVLLFFSQLLEALPQPILAAVVLAAVVGLFNLSSLIQFWRSDRVEFTVAMASMLGVLSSGLLRGVLIGAIISLVLRLRRASNPHVALLGRIPGTQRFSDCERHPENELMPGVAICRPESSLLYFNIHHVCEVIQACAHRELGPLKLVILDLSNAAYVDMQSAHSLAHLARELAASGIRVQAVEAHAVVRDRLRAGGMDAILGGLNHHISVTDRVSAFLGQKQPSPDREFQGESSSAPDAPHKV